ncbi:hypothetical protein JCM1840_003227 [Sporobolomyces johnsonii]
MAEGRVHTIRTTTYAFTLLSCTVCWVLSAVFISLTESNFHLYYSGSAVLTTFGILAMLFLPLLVVVCDWRNKEHLMGALVVETLVLFIFWIAFLGGASTLSSQHGWTSACVGNTCAVGRALLAMAWISWLSIFGLLAHAIVFAFSQKVKELGEEFRGGDAVPVKPEQNGERGSSTSTVATGTTGPAHDNCPKLDYAPPSPTSLMIEPEIMAGAAGAYVV